jgi:hypothetical protein
MKKTRVFGKMGKVGKVVKVYVGSQSSAGNG